MPASYFATQLGEIGVPLRPHLDVRQDALDGSIDPLDLDQLVRSTVSGFGIHHRFGQFLVQERVTRLQID
ncbi:MAG: hypothetical protein ACQESR_11335 [Planctomycetota bacterium]